MARGAQAKLRRRNRKKDADAAVTDMFGSGGDDHNDDDDAGADDIPLPPSMSNSANVEADTSDDDLMAAEDENLPKKKKKSKSKGGLSKKPPTEGGVGGGGIKTTPLILLALMVGTSLLPVLIYAGDFMSSFLAKNNVAGAIGFRLGIGAVPKKRVISFYEKHAPEKLNDVPDILAKHYGKYPTLIKKLERKYQDYGYFMGWEEDEAPIRIATEHLKATYDIWLQQYWNRYAPQVLKTAARNIRYNVTFLIKKGRKLYKKHVWPMLEPIIGVPDGAAAQKRKDAAEARKRREATSKRPTGTRRKNTDYRDDVED